MEGASLYDCEDPRSPQDAWIPIEAEAVAEPQVPDDVAESAADLDNRLPLDCRARVEEVNDRRRIGPFHEPTQMPRVEAEDPSQDMAIQTPQEPDAEAKDSVDSCSGAAGVCHWVSCRTQRIASRAAPSGG